MNAQVWKDRTLVHTFLEGVRSGIPLAAEQLDMMLRIVGGIGRPVRAFADLGCGSGVLAAAMLEKFPRARATLVDFSEPMLDQARLKFAARNSQVDFVLADLGSTAWTRAVARHAPFDAVVSGFSIHHLPTRRKRRLYCEIFDLLRPGGVFLNLEHVASPTGRVESLFDSLMIDSLHRFHNERKTRAQIAKDYVHRPDKAANILEPVELQCRWLRAIGFDDVDCYFKVFELALFGGRRPPRR